MTPGVLGPLACPDHDQLGERRLLLAAELGAIFVAPPAARRDPERQSGGRTRIETEAADVDDQPGLARGEQPSGERSAGPLVDRLVVALAAEADQQHAPRNAVVVDEGLGDRRELALEALGVGGAGGERAGGLGETGEPLGDHVLAPRRDGERIGAFGTGCGEADLEHGCTTFPNTCGSRRARSRRRRRTERGSRHCSQSVQVQ